MSTGSGGFSGFLARTARTVFENAINSTNTTTAGGMQYSRSFLGSDMADISTQEPNVIEYGGRNANIEIAEIYPISARAGDLILHGPRKSQQEASNSYGSYSLYNIILHSTNSNSSSEKMYSLFRTESEDEASRVFVVYKQIFPDLVKASANAVDIRTLEKIARLSKAHKSYAAVHVAAALGMVEQLKSPALKDKLTDQEGDGLLTPLHVACVHAKLDAFKAIAEDERVFNRVYDYDDSKGNNVVHLAAKCADKAVGAAIIKILREKLVTSQDQITCSSRSFFQLCLKVNSEGNAPIHLACVNENIEAAQLLIDLLDFFTNVENNDNVPLNRKELLPSDNLPKSDREALVNIKAVATGSTPLHLAVTNSQLLSKLLASGSDPNAIDNEGLTPLHKAVLDSNLASTLHLLANKANPDITFTNGRYSNATALHVAAHLFAIDCMKALIVFGANIDAKDGNGHTPRHIVASVASGGVSVKQEAIFVLAAAGATRCSRSSGCAEACKVGGRNDGKKPDSWKIKKDGTSTSNGRTPVNSPHGLLVHEAMRGLSIVKESYETSTDANSSKEGPVVGGRLLSLDGGGIRGLVLTQMLFFMEKEFASRHGGSSVPIISYFDWVAGTSTGGILALALACGKSVLETQSLYMKLKDKVFTGSRPYNAGRMEEFLKKEFGHDRKMSSIKKPRVMIMTALANRRPPDLYIFRNYISPCCQLGDPEEYSQFPDETYVWETAKVTGAAPSYFTLDHEMFIDGGLISNNPTLDALSELVQFKAVMMNSQQSASFRSDNRWKLPSLVVSLGTGIPPRQDSAATNLDIAWPTGLFDAVRNVPRLTHLVNLLVDQATQSEGQVVERARAWCASIGVPFFRFSPEMSADIDLDEKQDDVLVNLMWETWCYMVGNKDEIKEIYDRLRGLDVSGAQPMDISN